MCKHFLIGIHYLNYCLQRNSSHDDHPFLARIAQDLVKSGNLLTFWVEHFDAALDLATKAKTLTAFHLLIRIVHLADSEVVKQAYRTFYLRDIPVHMFFFKSSR